MSKLLIVDNSTDLLEAMKITLESLGNKVRVLSSATNIHNIICEFKPDLLILDIFLDAEDGRDICKAIRKNISRNLPVLMFSASNKILEDYKSYYADDVLEKPFDLKNLVGKIKSLIQHN